MPRRLPPIRTTRMAFRAMANGHGASIFSPSLFLSAAIGVAIGVNRRSRIFESIALAVCSFVLVAGAAAGDPAARPPGRPQMAAPLEKPPAHPLPAEGTRGEDPDPRRGSRHEGRGG